jgi:uncharacterized protein (DUF1778 family)
LVHVQGLFVPEAIERAADAALARRPVAMKPERQNFFIFPLDNPAKMLNI